MKRNVISTVLNRIYKDGFKILFDILMLKKNINYDEVQISFRSRVHGDSKLNSTTLHIFGQIIENLTRNSWHFLCIFFYRFGRSHNSLLRRYIFCYRWILLIYLQIFFGSVMALASNYTLNNFLTFNNLHNTNYKRFIGFLYSLFKLSLIANIGIASILYYDNFSIAISSFVGILTGLLLNYFSYKGFCF